ncbi:hypothetical protein CMUST_06175 [Corynebacterium mustelae]|uniref:Uncharacterized protein n=1 Tax=Corynebacterium mustelae TaxID=571915 RepID=A0A0G3GWL9_9CORY|nr:hypothetical protein [Corynebacterium mustelae]AKK05571.1 hypothetical protein CMUST_06175 [Corynebacterium mustelae]
MSFFEDIAAALDAEGIESRVHADTMFIPITSELEIQFVEIDPHLPAANVYIAAAAGDDSAQDFEAVLVSVVFSVEDAVNAVNSHVVTDQVVTVLRDLLEGTDERIEDLDFFQSHHDENVVYADLTEFSGIEVSIDVVDGMPIAKVDFITLGPLFEQMMESAYSQVEDIVRDNNLSEQDADEMFESIVGQIIESCQEVLELGSFSDFDKLFDVLSLAADQAEAWENQLAPLEDEDEPDIYDIFGEDDGDESDFYYLEDDALDEDDQDVIDYTDN